MKKGNDIIIAQADEMEEKKNGATEDINPEEMDNLIAEAAEEAETTESEAIDGEELLRQLNNAAADHADIITIDTVINRTRQWMASGGIDITEEKVTNPTKRSKLADAIMTQLNNERNDAIAKMVAEEKEINTALDKEATKAVIQGFAKLLPPQVYMPPSIIADILALSGIVKLLDYNDEEGATDARAELLIYRLHDKKGLPTIYQPLDESKALAEPQLFEIISELNSHTSKQQREDILTQLHKMAPRVYASKQQDTNYVYAANGIIDCHGLAWNPVIGVNMRKDGSLATLLPWGTPEAEAVVAKEYPLRYSTVATYTDAQGIQPPVMYSSTGKPWDPVTGIRVVFDDNDEASPALIWQIIQATLRGTNFGHATIFANRGGSRGGGNCKDTIMGIMKELLGEYNTMSVSIHHLGTLEFPIDGLQNKAGIFSSEEEGGKTSAKLFKLLARQDGLIEIRRKHLPTIYIRWKGMTIWCMNEDSINFTDKSDSVWRDVIVITFEKSFEDAGTKIPEVKDDFIHRKETRDYVLWHAINRTPWIGPEGYKKELIQAMEKNRKAMRAQSNPVFIFLNEMMLGNPAEGIEPKIPWTQVPAQFLYNIYKIWARQDNAMNHITATASAFTKQVAQWANEHRDTFTFEEGNAKLGKQTHREKMTKQNCPALEEYRPEIKPRATFIKCEPEAFRKKKEEGDICPSEWVIFDTEAEKQYRNRLIRIQPLPGWEDD